MSSVPVDDEERRRRMTAVSMTWVDPANWSEDGNEWLGSGLPPWGRKARCRAVKNGHHCRKPAISGGVVCPTHGGSAGQVKRKAKLRALQLVDPAMGRLAMILANPDDQRVALAAVKLTMDINGMLTKGVDTGGTEIAKALLMERFATIQQEKAAREAEAMNELDQLEAQVLDEVVSEVDEVVYEADGSQRVSEIVHDAQLLADLATASSAPAPTIEPVEPIADSTTIDHQEPEL